MHALIINGSPRVKKYSNTDKILEKITSGMKQEGASYEQYEISDRRQWDTIRERFYVSTHILIALPLFVECIPGLLMEFLETIPLEKHLPGTSGASSSIPVSHAPSSEKPVLSFLLQSGFAEGAQLRCGEEYLKMLAEKLGCTYGGTLVKGDNFSIRLFEGQQREKIVSRYEEMGRIYGRDGAFADEACRAFTGPEEFPLPVRILVGLMFKTLAKKSFKDTAKKWGCTRPLNDRPYERDAWDEKRKSAGI